MPNDRYTYICRTITGLTETTEANGEFDWSRCPVVQLADSRSGAVPLLATTVQCGMDDRYLRFRFECEDDEVVATMLGRDDPLYREDVVEMFIDETCTGKQYVEIEISPNNVIFDARISNDLQGSIQVDAEWDAEGLMTSVRQTAVGMFVYEAALPWIHFSHRPIAGERWSVNFYRIDQDAQGHRHYSAWSPTYNPSFHIPAMFGTLVFE